MKALLILACLISCLAFQAHSQKQLVLLKGQKVILRLNPGDDFVYKLKNSKQVKRSYVNNLYDNAVLTHRDTVPFNKIDRLYFRRTTRGNVIGGTLMFAGGALFILDQLNNSAIQGNDLTLDRGVSTATLGMIAVGLPLFLIKKNSQKIGFKYRLFTVKKGSSFYVPENKRNLDLYIDN